MADSVNSTHKARLSPQNSEPSHIAGKAPYTEIGGVRGVDAEPNTAKVDGAGSLSADSTIPKAVSGETSHLSRVTGSEVNEADDDVEVKFDGDVDESTEDDLDKELDQFEDVEPVDVDVDIDKKVNESDDDDDKPAFLKKVDEDDESDDDKKLVKEDDERGDNNATMQASFDAAQAVTDSGTNDVKEDDEDDADVSDDKKLDEDDENPFAKKDDDKKIEEKFRINIKLPNSKLFESVGVSAKSQKKIGVLFESALRDAVKQASTQLHGRYKALHESKIAKRDAVLAKQMDSYLNYVVEQWVGDNKVAIRQSLRTQLAEEFMDGLKRLFTESYIDVPQGKVDVVKQLTKQVQALKTSLNEQHTQKLKLRRLAESANKKRIVSDFVREQKLSEAQIVKLMTLAENTQYTTAKEFREKLSMLRESYFTGGTKSKTLQHLPEETIVDAPVAKTVHSDPLVEASLRAQKDLNDAGKW